MVAHRDSSNKFLLLVLMIKNISNKKVDNKQYTYLSLLISKQSIKKVAI